ncbi:helix-turn-helix domain-containing protein [Leifsonia sp. fls2-241-R2A-40a]|uniref:winged helix-turn-helix transcriptional regulator n=1 Tax=Leifsonia sp. fls2-241-R2A-40a TaxID=3040290 RepID=UPI00254E4132|nr:helix-turn-helix domain-containing protein [Leifsonia sp. fls2-241-R2A-40a]
MSNLDNSTANGLKSKPTKDSLAVALDAINDRWSLHIVRALAFGASRYTEILRSVGAPRDVLSARLKKLAETGIIQAKSGDSAGAGYELTQKGKDLGQVILVLKRWGDTYRPDDVPLVEFTHDVCGNVFVADVRCEACGRTVKSGEFSVRSPDHAC